MENQRNIESGSHAMSLNMTQKKASHFDGVILPRLCLASTSSTSSAISQQSDSGISTASSQSTISKYQCVQHCNFPYCDDVDKYERIAKIGQGTYGEVFKARMPSSNRFVALKRILPDNGKPGVSIFYIRIGIS